MTNEFKVYLDLDGVVFDIDKFVRDNYGSVPAENWFEPIIWPTIEAGNYFFANLPLKEGALELIDFLNQNFKDWEFLTATGIKHTKQIQLEKQLAVIAKTRCDNHINFVERGSEKYKILLSNFQLPRQCILIDDYENNVVPFRQKGAKGILYKNVEQCIAELKQIIK